MILILFLIILGFALIIKGADFLVKGASSLARRYNVSELIIGLTIVSIGTSAPEMVVNLIASVKGYNDVVLGNIIGSNNYNLYIILGISAILYPVTIHRSMILKEIPYTLVAAFAVLLLANDVLLFQEKDNMLSRMDGFILLAFFVLFMIYIFRHLQDGSVATADAGAYYSMPKTLLLLFGGLAGLVIGGKLAVDNAIKLAQMLGVSERIIGLTIVAAGSSLPELATSVMAAYRKKSDIAVGNVVGSSIMNIFLILALSLIISPARYQMSFNIDLTLLIVGTILLLFFTYTGKRARIDRWEGILMLAIFISYTIWL
ncbi:MAG: calcium/sodium antiporter, partial [Bacteroidales bacterium]|nr:calcium/sodium antiporter [Bacteroidales bacterium]